MDHQELDTLFSHLRDSTPVPPDHLSQEVQLRLGLSAASVQCVARFAVTAGLTSLLLAAWVSFSVSQRTPDTAPPSLGLFNGSVSPFASL
jgi:hypothetical protein